MLTPAARDHVAWCQRRRLAPSTLTTRRTVLTAICARIDPLAATAGDLEHVLARRRHQAATRNLWLSHMRSFYAWAHDEQLVAVDPTRRVARAQVPDRIPRPIPEDALAAALAGAGWPMVAWVTLGAYAGLRCCEIATLRPTHIDLRRGVVHVERSKGGRSRNVPMHPRVVDVGQALVDDGGWDADAHLVCVLVGRHLRATAGAYTAHQLRHRFATAVYEATGDLNVVRELLGHASVATTQMYARVSDARRSAAVALIA